MEAQIIEFLREHPVLYDKKFRGYKNNALKEKLWQELAVICNVAVSACKNRWRSLRDRYIKEMRRRNLPSGSGAAENDPWPWFDSLCFLRDSQQPRPTSTSVTPAACEELLAPETPPDVQAEVECPMIEATPPEKERRRRDNSEIPPAIANFLNRAEGFMRVESREEDETPYLEMVRLKLRRFPERVREDLKMEILNWLHEKEREYENENANEV